MCFPHESLFTCSAQQNSGGSGKSKLKLKRGEHFDAATTHEEEQAQAPRRKREL